MSLQRLLVYSPLAALVAVCLAVRVASEQTVRRHDSTLPARIPVAAQLQTARSVESSASTGATSWLPLPSIAPPADVPGLVGPEKANAAVSKTSDSEQTSVKRNEKTVNKRNAHTDEDAASPTEAGHKSASKLADFKLAAQTPVRKPETWTPPAVYGPPLPPDRIHVQKQAHQLRKDLQAGRLTLVMEERDGEQLEKLERSGVYGWPVPPANVVVRSDRQRNVLAGTTEDAPTLFSTGLRLQLASRSGEWERTALNPADDPDFDPCAVPPSPLLLRLLTTLAGHSTSAHPLQILSLLRPPYRFGGYVHVGPANPHSMGLAVDIGAYCGHAVRQSDPDACVAATLALLRDLPPGRYRLGMPKAPEGGWDLPPALVTLLRLDTSAASTAKPDLETAKLSKSSKPGKASADTRLPEDGETESFEHTTACAISALYGLYASSAKPVWPFFPPPFTQIVADEAVTEESGGKSARTTLRFQNEAYAPESDLADARLRKALEQARKRGVDIVAMFPDGADHIHVDVRQNP